MAVLKLQKYGSSVLREKATPITKIDEEIKDLANNMIETMYVEGGVGLAAPQVGVSKRIIVVDVDEKDAIVLVNPMIISREGQFIEEEGCLSVPGIYSQVKRSFKVTVEALDLKDNRIKITREGFPAVVFQHEIDHLDGYLFVDRLSPAKRLLIKDQLKEIESMV